MNRSLYVLFYQSSVAGIQEALSSFALLAIIDDLEHRKKVFFIAMNINPMMIMFYKQFAKEEQHALASYEGAITQTISGGSRRRVRNKMMLTFVDSFLFRQAAPVCITMNPTDKVRQEQYIQGRCVVLNCENCPYEVNHYLKSLYFTYSSTNLYL